MVAGAAAMGAVAIVVIWVTVVVVEVVPMYIVYISIAIIVLAVALDFPWVRPSVACDVFMVVVKACVNNGNDKILVAGVLVPRQIGTDLRHTVELDV